MVGLLLYFPGRTQPIPSGRTDRVPSGYGLEAMVEGATWSRSDANLGETPDGSNGQLLALAQGPEGNQARSGFDNDAQQWLKVKSREHDGSKWFGWWKDAPPAPPDLARGEPGDGWPVKLGDGREWIIPVVQPGLTTLSLSFRRGDDSKWGGVPLARYEALIEETAKWVQIITHDGDVIFHEVVEYCTRVLLLNYRVHVDLLNHNGLELLDTRSASEIIDAAVGLRTIHEREKQGEAAPSAA